MQIDIINPDEDGDISLKIKMSDWIALSNEIAVLCGLVSGASVRMMAAELLSFDTVAMMQRQAADVFDMIELVQRRVDSGGDDVEKTHG